MPPTVTLIGIEGFGRVHLNNLRRLIQCHRITLIALVDPVVKSRAESDPTVEIPSDAPLFSSLAEATEAVGVASIVIVSTPIHLHASLAREAMQAGSDVYIEKPPFACMADFHSLLGLQRTTGRLVQVGFQSLGSEALTAFDTDSMAIGTPHSVRATGFWLRKRAYWNRARWVGKRSLGDVWVMDGVATNALAHAVITALRIAKARRREDVLSVEVETYRANPIDADDTTSIRIKVQGGSIVTAGLTLCASKQVPPVVEVVGNRGTAVFEYTTDDVQITIDGRGEARRFERMDLTENLLDHRERGTPLLCSLEDTGAYMEVLEEIRLRGEPAHIERRWVKRYGEEDESYPVIQDVEDWISRAAASDSLLSEAGTPWAFTTRDTAIFEGQLNGQTVFQIQDGAGTAPSSSPRPFLHPITTLAGVDLTAVRPSDHDWHLGAGFAIPDVDGITYWGGGTYVHGKGYVLLDNFGTQRITSAKSPSPQALEQVLDWVDNVGKVRIEERRLVSWRLLESNDRAVRGWELSFSTSLNPINGKVSLGSPGTNGRVNAGYGGFNWRLPRCSDVKILSEEAEGEDTVHGSTSSWIAWSARFEAHPGACGDATVVLIAGDEASARDPWIVRHVAYPGLGAAIAWKDRVEIPAGDSLSRSYRIGIMDGRLDRATCSIVAGIMRGSH